VDERGSGGAARSCVEVLLPDAIHAGCRPDVVDFFSALRTYLNVGAGSARWVRRCAASVPLFEVGDRTPARRAIRAAPRYPAAGPANGWAGRGPPRAPRLDGLVPCPAHARRVRSATSQCSTNASLPPASTARVCRRRRSAPTPATASAPLRRGRARSRSFAAAFESHLGTMADGNARRARPAAVPVARRVWRDQPCRPT
jgi:hypothetical protein